jgi:hypothetical protein
LEFSLLTSQLTHHPRHKHVPVGMTSSPKGLTTWAIELIHSSMQSYTVEDQYADPVPLTDAWAGFLSARYSKREALYESLAGQEKESIKKELRRIKYLRQYFEGHRLSPADCAPLLVSLEKSHKVWRNRATGRSKEELHRCEIEIAKATGYRRQELNRQRLILRQVQRWPTQQYADLQQSMAPESYIAGLDKVDDSVDDNPEDPDYGTHGWLIAFKKGQGGVTLDEPLCHGKFPHQKISMQRLLYDRDETPLKRSANRTQLRYFHLQANNMQWVEDAIARYYGEDDAQLGSQRGPYQRSIQQVAASQRRQTNTEKLLKRELWHGQERGGVNAHMPHHSRQIRPRCAFVPSPEGESLESKPDPAKTYFKSSFEPQDVVMFVSRPRTANLPLNHKLTGPEDAIPALGN